MTPDGKYEPDDFIEVPCWKCETKGCVKCGFIGFRVLTKAEIEQEQAEMRRPERS